jgi:hypothetical protein
MWGGKRWLSQVNDHEVSAEFEVESGGVVLKLEGAVGASHEKAGLEMQIRWTQPWAETAMPFCRCPQAGPITCGGYP